LIDVAFHDDHALTEEESKWYRMAIQRQTYVMNASLHDDGIIGSPLEAVRNDSTVGVKLACLFFMDRRLFRIGRGVRVHKTGKLGYVVDHVGPKYGPKRNYKVQLCHDDDNDADDPSVAQYDPSELRLLSLNDMRHDRHGMNFADDNQQPGVSDKSLHPYDAQMRMMTAQGPLPLPEGAAWEYQDVHTKEWRPYHAFIQNELESMYTIGSPHFLYRPDAPHCIGGYADGSLQIEEFYVGQIDHMVQHDVSTRQVILKAKNRAGRPLMTFLERDLYTGMKRLVRRTGTPPEQYSRGFPLPFPLATNVLLLPKKRYCGLCHSTSNRLVQMECCGGYVCDTEPDYQLGSYERKGQCARNHRLNSICFWHFQEGHSSSDWKTCQDCQSFFHPYDYAVKASSMADSGTCRRYNFDDNVRTDLEPWAIDLPVCQECQRPVDTTEETTRTLSMRKTMGGDRVLCVHHGGGFGKINMEGLY
jgi:hypothetical protein